MSRNQTDIDEAAKGKSARFDVTAIAASFHPTASTLLIDHYLTNRQAASARVFRVYKSTPPHYHATCDEYLLVLSGRGTFGWRPPRRSSSRETYSSSSAARCVLGLTFLRSRGFPLGRYAVARAHRYHLRQSRRRYGRDLYGPQRFAVKPGSRSRDMSVPPDRLRQPKIDYLPWLGFQ
jgi:mannose-6-phosphate isomerase-like protein (cupin superfamily)